MMICNCTLAGTQACKNCPRYNEYFGEQTSFSRFGFYEVVSRSKGKWIDNTCSICGYTSLLNPYALVEENGHMKEELSQKFCPNCGADMRGEVKNAKND